MVVMTLVHACIAMFTTMTNLVTAQRRIRKSSEHDTRRLRILFTTELGILRESFMNNIDAIYEEKSVIMSSRAIVSIYRANLGRLNILGESEIPSVVAAYAFCENIEAFLSAHGKPNGQSSYSMGKERLYANELIALYGKGAEMVDRALIALSESGGRPGRSRASARDAAQRPTVQPDRTIARCA
jgi:hypothetical protein